MTRDVSSFVGDLVQMAKAMEELPHVQAELAEAQASNLRLSETVGQREESILKLKAQIEALQAEKRSLEVERDTAQFQVLEEQEARDQALAFVKMVAGNAASLLKAVEPPMPQPEPQPDPAIDPGPAISGAFETTEGVPVAQGEDHPTTAGGAEASLGQSEALPTSAPFPAPSTPPSTAADSGAVFAESAASSQRAESAQSPTATSSTQEDATSQSQSATSSGVESMASVSTQPSEGVSVPSDPTLGQKASSSDNALQPSTPAQPDRPYAGKRYTDVPYYVSLVEWLSGGGTEELYYAR